MHTYLFRYLMTRRTFTIEAKDLDHALKQFADKIFSNVVDTQRYLFHVYKEDRFLGEVSLRFYQRPERDWYLIYTSALNGTSRRISTRGITHKRF